MKCTVFCTGSLKEKYWKDAVSEYMKRLRPYCRPEIIELKEAKLPANASPADEAAVKEAEGRDILSKLDRKYVVTLEIKGKKLSSEKFSEKIEEITLSGTSDIAFVIGGSLGLSDEVSRRADFRLSFSDMTFPHQMMRVILLEQIYRAFRISRGEPYHK
jgi:23S rRNA (pseudouridine1915-N3)-methyltransferase